MIWHCKGATGLQEDSRAFLHNHLRFTILYHGDAETGLARIVGFEVEPFSVKHKFDGKWDPEKPELKTCNPSSMKFVTDKDTKQEVKENEEIIFTYDVSFKVSTSKPRQTFPGCLEQQPCSNEPVLPCRPVK